MSSKSSETVLDTFKEILHDINETCSEKHTSEVGVKILSKIKNTMSDRAMNEKKFHQLLEDYNRQNILPAIIPEWQNLTMEEQTSRARMNNFFVDFTY